MEPISLIRVFIASPADVPKERTAVEEACNRTNIELGDYLKIRLEAVRWETHTVPSFAGSIQEIIYKQIDFEKLDLFVGILGNTFGTKSSIKDSGTYHEFQKAVELAEKNLTPHIMLYFGDKDLLDPNDVNEQKKKEAVKEFRSTLKERLYRQYKKDEITNR